MSKSSANRFFGGVLLVSGTTIGAGMLALPTVTGLAGFWPTSLLFVFYWIFMTYTAFLILEVNLWMPGEAPNLITMAGHTLGKWGEVVNWTLYLLLLYLLTTAYIVGTGSLISNFVETWTSYTFSPWICFIPLLMICAIFVYEGVKYVDYANRLLMIGLGVAYVGMMSTLAPTVDHKLLRHVAWEPLLLSVSLAATSFGFHVIIPTLVRYLDHDVPLLKRTLFVGSIIPILLYLSWEYLALGTVPLSVITAGFHEGIDGGKLLASSVNNGFLQQLVIFFAFFALVTSFLGVSQSLRDFLADGLHIPKTTTGRLLLDFLTFLPPLLFILVNSRAFLDALSYAGAFGVVTVLAIMPALMAWSGRYKRGLKGPFRTPGGKPALVLVILISTLVILLEVGIKMGALDSLIQGL